MKLLKTMIFGSAIATSSAFAQLRINPQPGGFLKLVVTKSDCSNLKADDAYNVNISASALEINGQTFTNQTSAAPTTFTYSDRNADFNISRLDLAQLHYEKTWMNLEESDLYNSCSASFVVTDDNEYRRVIGLLKLSSDMPKPINQRNINGLRINY
jgi:hypothetical protein